MIWLIIIGRAFIFEGSKEMSNSGASKSSSHIVGCYIFVTSFDVSLLISGIVSLILELFDVLELGVFALS